jgi:AraC-like DNA-binding protein
VQEIQREIEGREAGHKIRATALLLQLVVELCRQFTRVPTSSGRELLKMSEVIDYLANARDIPTLGELAQRARMSVSSFQRSFRRATGASPRNYATSLRMRRAIEHLRRDDTTVTEAAGLAGFEDSNYFSRVFRRHTGLSPRQWRALAHRKLTPVSS